MKLPNVKRDTAKHICVFGPPKLGGKTYLVGSLAKYGFKLKYFDLENGRETLLQLPLAAQENIEVYRIPDTKEYPIAIETIMKVVKGNLCKICWEHGKIDCALCLKEGPKAEWTSICLNDLAEDEIAVIDSVTQLSNSAMNHIGLGKPDTWKPEWENYRTQGAMLDRIFSTVQNAPWNCIVITHELSLKMEDDRERIVPICGTREFGRNFAKYFGDVVYCEVKNRKHVAASSTIYSPNILTGSRTGVEIEKQEPVKPGEELLEGLVKLFRKPDAHNQNQDAKTLLKGV